MSPIMNLVDPRPRLASAVLAVLAAVLPAASASAQERPVLTLGDLASAEVRQEGFTLPRPMKVHLFARGEASGFDWEGHANPRLFATGWLLNAATREVVWQMDLAHTRTEHGYRIADVTLELPAGSYEAYFADYGFGQWLPFGGWIRNIDRRSLQAHQAPGPGHHSLLGLLGISQEGAEREWLRRAGQYGLQVSVAASDAGAVETFPAPLRWANIRFALAATGDNGRWTQAFRVRRPVVLHLYAEGEASGSQMVDAGWIVDARTRQVVWEMTTARSSYAGGAGKNRRQVETLRLPPGDYVATYATDDSHSPADWNALPPCDPGFYGLVVATPGTPEADALTLIPEPAPGAVLAELVRVGNDEHRQAGFTLAAERTVRVRALGEEDDDGMADTAWIEDASGRKVWRMETSRARPAGGASKNREVDETVTLARGHYTLHVRTDDSHAYGSWNAAPPADPEHYGATVYAVD